MKLPGTPDIKLSMGLLKPNSDSMKLPMNVPIAAPTPATIGVDIKANRAGTTTPGLKCPMPHGVGIGAVTVIAAAYRAADIAIKATLSILVRSFDLPIALYMKRRGSIDKFYNIPIMPDIYFYIDQTSIERKSSAKVTSPLNTNLASSSIAFSKSSMDIWNKISFLTDDSYAIIPASFPVE